MQLGELQNQIERFQRRDVSILAISVDKPRDSLAMVKRMGLTFHLGSDPDQSVVRAFRVQNPDTQELALHAVYIMDNNGRIYYRKVARRRPVSNELIDAIDAHRGQYPQNDPAKPRRRVDVAYPTNNFQALLEVAGVQAAPDVFSATQLQDLWQVAGRPHNDDSLIALRSFMERNAHLGEAALLATVNWMSRRAYFPEDNPASKPALAAGEALIERLATVNRLEEELDAATGADHRDQILQELLQARARLTRTRAMIEEQAGPWRLRALKTSIRSYREVALAAIRSQPDK